MYYCKSLIEVLDTKYVISIDECSFAKNRKKQTWNSNRQNPSMKIKYRKADDSRTLTLILATSQNHIVGYYISD